MNNQNRNQFIPNQRPPMNQMRNPMMNNPQPGYIRKQNVPPQQPPRPAVQNPRMNQVGINMKNNMNAYQGNPLPQKTNVPGQLNIINRNDNISPNRINAYQKQPGQIARPVPIAQIKQQNILNRAPVGAATPTKRPAFNIYNNQQNQRNKNVRPVMQRQVQQIRRVASDRDLLNNKMNLGQPPTPQKIIQFPASAKKIINNAIVQQPVQNVVNQRYAYRNPPQKQIVVNQQRMQYMMTPTKPL